MPNFILIDPTTKTLQNLDAADYKDAVLAAGLNRLTINHTTVSLTYQKSYHIWTDKFGLTTPETDKYFAINKKLFNGLAVMYCVAQSGETIDVHPDLANFLLGTDNLIWLDGIDACEVAIAEGKVDRPQSAINGEVIWEWNKPGETSK